MDEVDSPDVAQKPEQGDSPPTPGQELSSKPKRERSEPENRINGLMGTLGKRTQERDEARAETQRLREQLNAAVTGYDPSHSEQSEPQQQTQPQQQPQPDFVDEAITDRLPVVEPTGHVDPNNPGRSQASPGYPRSPEAERDSLRQQLNAAVHSILNQG